ncbi:MAG: hypothetical protein NTW67_05385, partial [Candidatus Woesearchaeota archaeon]|nr:hypothetical protein [Candidatus Woesearchaeota archaeon]
MNLQGLGKVENYQKYLDMAYKNGTDAAAHSRQETTSRNKAIRSKRIESARIEAYGKSLMNSLDFIGRCFPSID